MKRVSTTVFLCLVTSAAIAQTYDLNPRSWFPLDVGNAWHFTDIRYTPTWTESVVVADKDSLINGDLWTRFDTKWCTGPSCCTGCLNAWFRWSDDSYLLTTYDPFTSVDTTARTTPRSIFTVNIPYDSTLQSPWAIPTSTNRVGYADVYVLMPDQVAADSTTIELSAHLGFNGEVYTLNYYYNVGPTDIVGAIVRNRPFGETGTIRSVLAAGTNEAPSEVSLDIYPNPFGTVAHIEFRAGDVGVYTLTIHDLLGALVAEGARHLSAGEVWSWSWSPEYAVADGVYAITVRNENDVVRHSVIRIR